MFKIFFVLMAILCVLDIRKRLIPNLIVIPATIIASIALKTYFPALITLVLAMLIYSESFWCGGDVKLATMVSAFMGFPGLIVMALSILLILAYGKIKNCYEIPTAPFIFATSFMVLLVGK